MAGTTTTNHPSSKRMISTTRLGRSMGLVLMVWSILFVCLDQVAAAKRRNRNDRRRLSKNDDDYYDYYYDDDDDDKCGECTGAIEHLYVDCVAPSTVTSNKVRELNNPALCAMDYWKWMEFVQQHYSDCLLAGVASPYVLPFYASLINDASAYALLGIFKADDAAYACQTQQYKCPEDWYNFRHEPVESTLWLDGLVDGIDDQVPNQVANVAYVGGDGVLYDASMYRTFDHAILECCRGTQCYRPYWGIHGNPADQNGDDDKTNTATGTSTPGNAGAAAAAGSGGGGGGATPATVEGGGATVATANDNDRSVGTSSQNGQEQEGLSTTISAGTAAQTNAATRSGSSSSLTVLAITMLVVLLTTTNRMIS